MTVFTEARHTAEFMVSEANGYRSREQITIASGQTLEAGAVLGQITASGEYTEYNPANVDGSETAVAICYAPTDASAAAKQATIIARDAEVAAAALTWFAGATAPQIAAGTAELEAVGIIAR